MNKEKEFKVSRKVSLPVNTKDISRPEFIPKNIGFEDNVRMIEQIAISLNEKLPVLLVGETGTGKTSVIRHLAYKTGNAFVRVNHNGGTTVEDILGRYVLDKEGTRWVDGILVTAMKEGFWYLADELNAASAEINFAYHQLLDDDGRVLLAEKGDEVVIPHPNFRFFGAINPSREYAGTKELNKALMSRFSVIKVDFSAPRTEQKILINRTGISPDVAINMVNFAVTIRTNQQKDQYQFVLSTRDLLMWAKMYKVYGNYMQSAEMSVLNKIDEEDVESIKSLMQIQFKALDDGKVVAPVGAIPAEAAELPY